MDLFSWPLGVVWGNLLASAVCVGIVWWRLRPACAHHVEQMAQAERHHKALKAHITAAALAPRPTAWQAKTLTPKPSKEAGP